MTFPCLVCGDLPVVDQPTPQPSSSVGTTAAPASASGIRNSASFFSFSGGGTASSSTTTGAAGGNRKGGGATIRTLSKDVSDKIFQNLCRHLYVKTEPYWFIQHPGEHMPLCAFCSGVVLEIYTLQNKVDQFQTMIKKLVWKLERTVADTEIAGNWMATREEQEFEEEMWNSIPCPPMAIRIARERHHKFRQQILQSEIDFKGKVKIRQKMRAAGQQVDEIYDLEPTAVAASSSSEPVLDNGEKCGDASASQSHFPAKRPRLDDTNHQHHQNLPGLIRTQLSQSPVPVRSSSSLSSSAGPAHGITVTNISRLSHSSASTHQQIKIPSTISVSAVGQYREQNQDEEEYLEEGDVEDEQNSQLYPDVQLVCSAGPADYFKEEQEYSNSGDGDDSTTMEQDSSYWNSTEDNTDDLEAMTIAEGEDAVWLAPTLALRKSFVNQLLTENLKPSVFLRKLVFAVFGMKQVARSSGICGSNKPGAKPSLDRYKFEALREYTIETYGIRDNIAELEDLNRKIRTICCDARKALKRKTLKITSISGHSSVTKLENLAATSSSSTSQHHNPSENMPTLSIGNIPDLYHLATGGSLNGNENTVTEENTGDDDNDDHDDPNHLQHIPVSVSLEEEDPDGTQE